MTISITLHSGTGSARVRVAATAAGPGASVALSVTVPVAPGSAERGTVLTPISKQPNFGLTQEWLRELSFSRLECGVHDRLHIYPLCTWHSHRHQIEGTNSFYNSVSSERHRVRCSL